jgi:uncharacterized protein (DUF2236 family)
VKTADLEDWCRWLKRRGAGRLRHVLMAEWDPIGVRGVPEARDEYDSYLGLVADRLRTGAPAKRIADLLAEIRTETMGMPPAAKADLRTARMLIAWYRYEMARLGYSPPGRISWRVIVDVVRGAAKGLLP